MTALCALAGCDVPLGVRRTATLSQLPSRAAIEMALHAVPEIERVEYHQVPAATSGSIYEPAVYDPAYDQFAYWGNGAGGVVEVRETGKGVKTLNLYEINFTGFTKEQIDHIRTLMDKVYASLRIYAPGIPPETQVHEIVSP